MKKKLFYFLAVIVSFGLIVSCDKTNTENDDNQEQNVDNNDENNGDEQTTELETIISESLAGTYEGTIVVTVTGEDPVYMTQELTVVKGTGELITLSFTNLYLGETALGSVSLQNYEVTDNGDETYSFEGSSSVSLMNGTVPATISGEGTFTLGDSVSLSANFNIDASSAGITATATYDGTKE